MTKKLDLFTNQYSLMKTLRMKAIPVGNTEENIRKARILQADKLLFEKQGQVKKILDRAFKDYIDRQMEKIRLEGLDEYAGIYLMEKRSEADLKRMTKLETSLKEQILGALKGTGEYKELLSTTYIKKVLPNRVEGAELEAVECVKDYGKTFSSFFESRKNLIEEKISERCIDDNLPRFLSNIRVFNMVKDTLGEEILNSLSEELGGDYRIQDIFTVDFFPFVLTQEGIDFYNTFLGGYSKEDGTKVKGLNEYINLTSQRMTKEMKKSERMENRLPLAKMLYKQILANPELPSFVDSAYTDIDSMYDEIREYYEGNGGLLTTTDKIESFFSRFKDNDLGGIYVKKRNISDLSHKLLGYWNAIQEEMTDAYMAANPPKKSQSIEEYEKKVCKAVDKIESISLADVMQYAVHYAEGREGTFVTDVAAYYTLTVSAICANIRESYKELRVLMEKPREKFYAISGNPEDVATVKNALDATKNLYFIMCELTGTKKESGRDEVFYGEFDLLYEELKTMINPLYNRCRNFVTKKPYSLDKFKLNFGHYDLFGGWDIDKTKDYQTTLFRKGKDYYIGILTKASKEAFDKMAIVEPGENTYEKLFMKSFDPVKTVPHVAFADNHREEFESSDEILRIKEKQTYLRSFGKDKPNPDFSVDDLHALIDYYKMVIEKTPQWEIFHFNLSPTESYENISEFNNELKAQATHVHFDHVSEEEINRLIDNGDMYFFRLYTKDFAEGATGNKDLNTLYFEAIFEQGSDYALGGNAELYFRPASLTYHETHKAGIPIKNKNELNPNKTTTKSYPLLKDRRFMFDQFEFHLPVKINNSLSNKSGGLNRKVREALINDENPYVIGVNRGEKNLISICVIDGNGNIVEQAHYNQIQYKHHGKDMIIDYKRRLEVKEAERMESRQTWNAIENIKELKSGYLSQIIHKIHELVVKYDAVVAIENLDLGFKHSRAAIEKAVYQKFETALQSKMKFMVDKKTDKDAPGGLLQAYQIANADSSELKGVQDGFIFRVSPWHTACVDPTTGFTDLLKPKYKNVKTTLEWLARFDNILFNKKEGYFEFVTDLRKFDIEWDHTNNWTICTNGSRTKIIKNRKTGKYELKDICLTESFISLLTEYGVDHQSAELKKAILEVGNYKFYMELMDLIRLTLQMRNLLINGENDYIISPVKNKNHVFYDSREAADAKITRLPMDASSLGAYNIARKALWGIQKMKSLPLEDAVKTTLTPSKEEWFEFMETNVSL